MRKQFFYVAEIDDENGNTYHCDGVVSLECPKGIPYELFKHTVSKEFETQSGLIVTNVSVTCLTYLLDIID